MAAPPAERGGVRRSCSELLADASDVDADADAVPGSSGSSDGCPASEVSSSVEPSRLSLSKSIASDLAMELFRLGLRAMAGETGVAAAAAAAAAATACE